MPDHHNSNLPVIGFDADDTLWPTSHLYDDVLAEFARRSARSTAEDLFQRHAETVAAVGYGAVGLQTTLISAAVEEADGPTIQRSLIKYALAACQQIHEDPAPPFLGVTEKLVELRHLRHRLVCITKGSPVEQHRKLARSGLEHLFDAVFVLPRKTSVEYRQVLKTLGVAPADFLMVGDSISGDVKPVLDIGGHAVLVGSVENWEDGGLGVDSVPTIRAVMFLDRFLVDRATRSSVEPPDRSKVWP